MTGCIELPDIQYMFMLLYDIIPQYTVHIIYEPMKHYFLVNYENHRSVIIEPVINAYKSGRSKMAGCIWSPGFSLYGQEFNLAP